MVETLLDILSWSWRMVGRITFRYFYLCLVECFGRNIFSHIFYPGFVEWFGRNVKTYFILVCSLVLVEILLNILFWFCRMVL